MATLTVVERCSDMKSRSEMINSYSNDGWRLANDKAVIREVDRVSSPLIELTSTRKDDLYGLARTLSLISLKDKTS